MKPPYPFWVIFCIFLKILNVNNEVFKMNLKNGELKIILIKYTQKV
jgi:hypothetical protein